MKNRALWLPLICTLVACARPQAPPPEGRGAEDPAPREAEAPIRTDRTRYAMEEGPFGPEARIVMTFHAPADTPVYLVNCNAAISYRLQERVDGAWTDVWGAMTNSCLSEPIVVPAGAARTETAVVESGAHAAVDSRRNGTRIGGGTYRVVWNGVLSSFDIGAAPFRDELPIEQRSSAPFVIDPPKPRDPTRASPRERPAEIASVSPEHGARAAGRAPIRVRFAPATVHLNGQPYLHLDGALLEDARMSGRGDDPSGPVELEYLPPRPLAPGLHEARVIYQDDQRRTRWYAWSFTVTPER